MLAVELAAFLGMTPAAVRQVIHRHQIEPAGRDGHAFLYDPKVILTHAGAHDRLTTRKRRPEGCPACAQQQQ